jgi:hypothetical protein
MHETDGDLESRIMCVCVHVCVCMHVCLPQYYGQINASFAQY